MSSPELWKAPGVVPSLVYDDVPAAAEWLARAFGFRERSEASLSWQGGSMTWMAIGEVTAGREVPQKWTGVASRFTVGPACRNGA